MSKPNIDEIMQNNKIDDLNTAHLRDMAKARIEIQNIDIPQNGTMKAHNKEYKYTKIEDMINVVEPILLKNNLLSNFTEVSSEEGKGFVKVLYRMRIIHTQSRQFFESTIYVYHNRLIQDIGSKMTYAKRYLYESILLIRGTPDLDGASISAEEQHKENAVASKNPMYS